MLAPLLFLIATRGLADLPSGSYARVGVHCGNQGVDARDPVRAARVDFTPDARVLIDLTNHAGCRILRWGTFEARGRALTLHLAGGCGACPTRGMDAPVRAFAGDVHADFAAPTPELLTLFRHDPQLDRALCPSTHVLMRRFARVAEMPREEAAVRDEVCARHVRH